MFGEFNASPVNQNIPQDPILKKQFFDDQLQGELHTLAKLVYQFFCSYFERNHLSDMKEDNSFDEDDQSQTSSQYL
jgi:hypothetical protein